MARGQTITEEEKTFGGKNFRGKLVGDPLTHIQEQVRKNIHKVTRTLKEEMVDMMKNRNKTDGAEGTSYTQGYAMKKNMSPQVKGGGYKGGQNYDYKWSGQLMSALEGRGRAKPSQGTMNVWVGFRRLGRRPIKKTKGSRPSRRRTIGNRELAEILTEGKGNVDRPSKPPFAIHRNEHQKLIGQVASALMDSSN